MIDTKRLATDAAYWRECGAPEDASHWCTLHKKWIYNQDWYDECCIPRPTKQEWEGGLPRMAIMVNPHEAPLHYGEDHLGKEVEVIEHLPDESCYVVRFDWGLGVLHDSMIDFGLYDIKSKHERQRDELINLLIEHEGSTLGEIADAILSRYSLEPKA